MSGNATVCLHRLSNRLDFTSWSWDVFVDNKWIGYLVKGEEKTFEVALGHHQIWVSSPNCVSPKIECVLADNGQIRLECGLSPLYANLLGKALFLTMILALLIAFTFTSISSGHPLFLSMKVSSIISGTSVIILMIMAISMLSFQLIGSFSPGLICYLKVVED